MSYIPTTWYEDCNIGNTGYIDLNSLCAEYQIQYNIAETISVIHWANALNGVSIIDDIIILHFIRCDLDRSVSLNVHEDADPISLQNAISHTARLTESLHFHIEMYADSSYSWNV
jgi:hypothetical protein